MEDSVHSFRIVKDPDDAQGVRREYAVMPGGKLDLKIDILEAMVTRAFEGYWEAFGDSPTIEVLMGDMAYAWFLADPIRPGIQGRQDGPIGTRTWETILGPVTVSRTRDLLKDQVEMRVRF